jgi:hypothetical protein
MPMIPEAIRKTNNKEKIENARYAKTAKAMIQEQAIGTPLSEDEIVELLYKNARTVRSSSKAIYRADVYKMRQVYGNHWGIDSILYHGKRFYLFRAKQCTSVPWHHETSTHKPHSLQQKPDDFSKRHSHGPYALLWAKDDAPHPPLTSEELAKVMRQMK